MIRYILNDVRKNLKLDLEPSALKEEDMIYYYFKMHDLDGNGKLDSFELFTGLNDHEIISTTESQSNFEHQIETKQKRQNQFNFEFRDDAGI